MSALDDLHQDWARQWEQVERDGQEALERYGPINSETCARVVELMRPGLEAVRRKRSEAEAEAIRQDRWFNGE